MRTHEDRPKTMDARAIDRLVDGDLDDLDRRELLLRLEDDPEGWRRCALAFLEDQAWKKALTGLAGASRPSTAEVAPARPRAGRPGSRARRLAMAASLIGSTFAAGFAAGGISRGPAPVEVVQGAPVEGVKAPSGPPARPIQQVGWLNLEDGPDGEAPTRRVPILSGPGLDERWLREQPPAVSAYDRARWERQGYQVDERRRLVSVDLQDGRRVSIPVDEVEVEYVGQEPL